MRPHRKTFAEGVAGATTERREGRARAKDA